MFAMKTVGSTTEFEAGDRHISEASKLYDQWRAEYPGVTWESAYIEFQLGLWLTGTLPGSPRKPVSLHFASCSCDYSADEIVRGTARLLWYAGFGREYDDVDMLLIFLRSTQSTHYKRKAS
jgi:hypothetical protein